MRWMGAVVMLVAGLVARVLAVLAKRPAKGDDLGSVSHHWLAEHRVDSP